MHGVRTKTLIAGLTLGAVLVGTAMASVRRTETVAFDPFTGASSTSVMEPTTPDLGNQGTIVNVPVRPPFRPPIRTPFTP